MFWRSEKEKQEKLKSQYNNEMLTLLDKVNSQMNTSNVYASLRSGTNDHGDQLHNVYCDFGYPNYLDFFNYWNMFRRFGIAARVVNLVPDLCWLMPPLVTSPNKQFESEFEMLVRKNKLWNRVKGLDKRQRVGRYAGLFVQVSDNKNPEEPMTSLNGIGNIINLKPIYEGQLEVTQTEQDNRNPNYGNPTMYNYNSGATGNRNDEASTSYNIHPDRLIMAAEGADDGSIYGISTLENIFNDLIDLRKISGAGGEGFYQNTRNAPIINVKDSYKAPSEKDKERIEEEINDFLSKWQKKFIAKGMEFQYPNISLDNPKEIYTNSLNNIAAGSGLPTAIIIGQQTGARAPEKDDDLLLNQMQSRRENFLDELVSDVIDWMIRYKALPAAPYEIKWEDMLASSDSDKVAIVKEMSATNKTQFDSAQPPVYSVEDMQKVAGVDVEMIEIPSEDIEEDGEVE